MKITFLGTKGDIEEESPKHRMFTSTLFEFEKTRLMVDVGEGWKQHLGEIEPSHILISHAHPDHAWGLDPSFKGEVAMTKATFELLKDKGILPKSIKIFTAKDEFWMGDIKVKSYPVLHSIKAPAEGFILNIGGSRIWYAPDFLWLPGYDRVWENLDVFIGDGSSPEKELIRRKGDQIFGHMSMRKQVELVAKVGAPKAIFFTHLGKDSLSEPKISAEIPEGTRMVMARDGMTISLKDFPDEALSGEGIQIVDIKDIVPKHVVKTVECPPGTHWDERRKNCVPDAMERAIRGNGGVLWTAVGQPCPWEESLIKNFDSYDPTRVDNKILLDDHRITHAWMATIRKGKQFKYSTEQVKGLHDRIAREIEKRGYAHETPIEMEMELTSSCPGELAVMPRSVRMVDDVFVKKLTDDELVRLDEEMHHAFKDENVHSELKRDSQIGEMSLEDWVNAHVFVWREMLNRELDHTISDLLTEKSKLWVLEYPHAPKGLSEEPALKFEEVWKALPREFGVETPAIFLTGSLANKGEGEDIDILVWSETPDKSLVESFLREVPEKYRDLVHFNFTTGPRIGLRIPLYAKAYRKMSPEHGMVAQIALASELKPGESFKPMKACAGFRKCEFFDPKELWTGWASKHIGQGIAIQPKYDGMRIIIHKVGDTVKMITEDKLRDRAGFFPASVSDLKKLKGDFILDSEMVEYTEERIPGESEKHIFTDYRQYPREDLIPWIVADKPPRPDARVVFNIHDCLYVNGKDIHREPYSERLKALGSLVETGGHLNVVKTWVSDDIRGFEGDLHEARVYPNSEGAMLKDLKSEYEPGRRSPTWAKIKNVKEIDVIVYKIEQPKSKATGKAVGAVWNYWAAIGPVPAGRMGEFSDKYFVKLNGKTYLSIGKTYNAGFRAKEGDIITVTPIRIAKLKDSSGKVYYTWMFPIPSQRAPGKAEPDGIDTAEKIAKVGSAALTRLRGQTEEFSDQTVKVRLDLCPLWRNPQVCPLMEQFDVPRKWQLTKVQREYLKFPIECPFATMFRCRYVKPYYYGLEDVEVPEHVSVELQQDDLPLGHPRVGPLKPLGIAEDGAKYTLTFYDPNSFVSFIVHPDSQMYFEEPQRLPGVEYKLGRYNLPEGKDMLAIQEMSFRKQNFTTFDQCTKFIEDNKLTMWRKQL